MKQMSLRMDAELHEALLGEAGALGKSLNQHIVDLTCQRGKVYSTNHNHDIQVHFSITYLGDLLVLGRKESFEAAYSIMKEAIMKNETVILERPYQNFIPSILGELKTLEELEAWKEGIANI